jgi:lysophospholipase L1-like esterase
LQTVGLVASIRRIGLIGLIGPLCSKMNKLPLILLTMGLALAQSGCVLPGPGQSSLASEDPMPVFTAGTRILFQGDSITDGNRDKSARDLNHIIGHGYQACITARFSADLAERHLVFMNRGISGNTVPGLTRRWQADTIDLKPDILSILIGVNDLGGGRSSPEQFEQQYDSLLASTVKALPDVKLVLGAPFGLPVGGKKAGWENYHAQLVGWDAIVARLAAKYHAAFVPYQAMFDAALKRAPAEYWIWDGVHPTVAGHQLMADEWVRVVRAAWPAAPAPKPASAAPIVWTPAPPGTPAPARPPTVPPPGAPAN